MSEREARNWIEQAQRNPGEVILRGGVNFAKRHPVVSGTWLAGLLISILFQGFSSSMDEMTEYTSAMYGVADIHEQEYLPARAESDHAYWTYYNSKGWFWTCNAACQSNYRKYLDSQARLNGIEKRMQQQKTVANKIIGPLSKVSVNEAWRMFWDAWERGKESAKRWTKWDVMFTMMDVGFRRRRDEDASALVSFIVQMAVRVLVNFTVGLVSAMISFIYNAFWFAVSFGYNLTTLIFFLGCIAVSFFVISSAIMAMYGATGLTFYAVGQMAQRRAVGGRAGANRGGYRRVHYHYD